MYGSARACVPPCWRVLGYVPVCWGMRACVRSACLWVYPSVHVHVLVHATPKESKAMVDDRQTRRSFEININSGSPNTSEFFLLF